jgi:hypothetical protein
MLLRGAEGRMWLFYNSESENLQYLWFDYYGQCQVYEFGIFEPNLVIPEEYLPLNMDSCIEIPVLLNGLPYRMIQSDDGWVGSDGIMLTRIFTPDKDSVAWYQKLFAHYTPKTEEMYWFLAKSFVPLENHPLNGRWENLSDNMILLNGQPYQMAEKKVNIKMERMINVELKPDRELILYNTASGDTICLLDANIPPFSPLSYIDEYGKENRSEFARYEKLRKKWKRNIKSSVLLNGKTSRLFRYTTSDDDSYWHEGYVYFDNNGMTAYYSLVDGFQYIDTDHYYWNTPTLWYQKGNTIFKGIDSQYKFKIMEVSSCGDTIKILHEETNTEYLYIDVKLPPPCIDRTVKANSQYNTFKPIRRER